MNQSIMKFIYPDGHKKAGQLMAVINIENIVYLEGDDETGGTVVHWPNGKRIIPLPFEAMWEKIEVLVRENYEYRQKMYAADWNARHQITEEMKKILNNYLQGMPT